MALGEWKSLEMLICEYTEGKERLTEAIAQTRARAATEHNGRRRHDLYRQAIMLEAMRADICYTIRQMQEAIERGK